MLHLLCLGDSITDCGRLFSNPPLGDGYVSALSRLLQQSGISFTIKNCGTDGFTVQRLLQNVSLYSSFSPDIITILIGVNDIGLMMNTDRTPAQQQAMMQLFVQNYASLLDTLCQTASRIILLEPFIFPWPDEYRLWIPHVKNMSGQIQKLAAQFHLPYILLHDDLNALAQEHGTDFVTTDGIHLTRQGQDFLAQKLFSKITLYWCQSFRPPV